MPGVTTALLAEVCVSHYPHGSKGRRDRRRQLLPSTQRSLHTPHTQATPSVLVNTAIRGLVDKGAGQGPEMLLAF